MARIKQLSKHIINQIAAGEVIERPASVVKELVENSIDAGATKISIEINNECRDIRVADNGCGIHPEDVMLAFSKHATSKLRDSEDLFDIHTLGFRGEALSSIISISKLTCTTRTRDFETGTKVKCENSEVKQVETGCAVGTIMDIKDLFYNLPVRLKFLRSGDTEFSYITDIVQSLALVNIGVAFELKKNGKVTLQTTGSKDWEQTVKELHKGIAENLKPVLRTDELSGLKISGFVSQPNFTRSSKKNYYIYINGRPVKCGIIQKAVDTVYKTLISNSKYPFVILNLEMPPDAVDVNVHPTKKEVRYRDPNQIFNFIRAAVDGALKNHVEEDNVPQNIVEFQPMGKEIKINREEDTMYISDLMLDKFEQQFVEKTVEQQVFDIPKEETAPEPEENIIGQYKNTYILIEQEEGLEIVDQHIAEERYIYEKLKSEKEVLSQMLFVSDVITVSPTDMAVLKENIDKFERFGYGIEFLSSEEIVFKKVRCCCQRSAQKKFWRIFWKT